MGLIDNFDRPKWELQEWAFHGASITPLLTPGDQRAFRCEPRKKFRFSTSFRMTEELSPASQYQMRWQLDPAVASQMWSGKEKDHNWYAVTNGDQVEFQIDERAQIPTRVHLKREILNGQEHQSEIEWELWALPAPAPAPAGLLIYGDQAHRELKKLFPGATQFPMGQAIPTTASAVVTCALSDCVMEYLDKGGRVLHLTSGLRGSFRTEGTWFGRGTVWAPLQPKAFFDKCSREMLSYLQLFELGGTDVIRGEKLWDQVEPLLAFLETHDLERVRPNLLLFLAGVGKGRLMVSCLRHEGGQEQNYAGLWLARELVSYLIQGPGPTRALSCEVCEALRTGLSAEVRKVEGAWQFRKDPKATGADQAWFSTDFDDSQWAQVSPRSVQEGEIWNSYDGWGWYRKRVEIPDNWKGRRVRLVFDSVDDMYELYVNGRRAGGHGKRDRSESSFLKRTWVDVSSFLRFDRTNLVTVRVYDWTGSGGLNGEVWFTTGPVDQGLDLLRR
jgi:hypothetical protein